MRKERRIGIRAIRLPIVSRATHHYSSERLRSRQQRLRRNSTEGPDIKKRHGAPAVRAPGTQTGCLANGHGEASSYDDGDADPQAIMAAGRRDNQGISTSTDCTVNHWGRICAAENRRYTRHRAKNTTTAGLIFFRAVARNFIGGRFNMGADERVAEGHKRGL